MTPRYYYFRDHDHPMGWGVRDGKTDDVIASGDKSICACVAGLLNGDKDTSVLDKWPQFYDAHRAALDRQRKPE